MTSLPTKDDREAREIAGKLTKGQQDELLSLSGGFGLIGGRRDHLNPAAKDAPTDWRATPEENRDELLRQMNLANDARLHAKSLEAENLKMKSAIDIVCGVSPTVKAMFDEALNPVGATLS